MRSISILIVILIIFWGCTTKTFSIEDAYAKREVYIPMRDGKRLFTAIYSPRNKSRKYPILLNRTPYRIGPYGPAHYPKALGPSPLFTKEGYIFVYQDVRGRFMSEGDYVNMRPFIVDKKDSSQIDESSDTYDTIQWLLNNLDGHNNRVGMWGISYPGFYTVMGMLSGHPALKAVSPQAPIADWFIGDDMHHHGAFSLTLAFNFFASFGVPRDSLTQEWPERFKHGTPDGYDFFLRMGPLSQANALYLNNHIPFWNDLMKHSNYDSFWQSRNILPHVDQNLPAVLTVGGWYDAEDLYGPLHLFKKMEHQKSVASNHLVMGPWYHGAWARSDGESLGDISFGSKTSRYYQQNIEFPFFQQYLKQDSSQLVDHVICFDTGRDRWQSFSTWPPETRQKFELYFTKNNGLDYSAPTSKSGSDSYLSDPSHPVPYINKISNTWERSYMNTDQRFSSIRPDVLTYRSEVLEDSLTLAGPLSAQLFVSTTGSAADWIVKVIDVYPDSSTKRSAIDPEMELGGYQQLVRAEIFRGKYRNSYENPEPFIPNQVTPIRIPLNDIFHTFKPGHRLMVQIQSSWFPLFDRNPQKFTNIYRAKTEDFIVAWHSLYHNEIYPSKIVFSRLIR